MGTVPERRWRQAPRAYLLLPVVACLGILAPQPAQGQGALRTAANAMVPAERMQAFLAAVMSRKDDSIAMFFSRTATFTFARTTHEREGNRTGVWRFSGPELLPAMRYGGPLYEAFSLNPHGHPVGPFFHQTVLREGTWRRIGGNRFVPPDAPASSPIFVEWRREGDTWVVAAFGDEIYGAGVPIPAWCC